MKLLIALLLIAASVFGQSVNGIANQSVTAGSSATTTGNMTGDAPSTGMANVVTGIRGRPVAATAPSNGQALVWNNTSSQWEPQNQSGTGTNATQIQSRNVAATAPTDTQVLCWDNTGNTWKPCTAVAGTGASSVPQLTDVQTTRTTSTALGVAIGNVQVNGVSYSIAAGTVGISAGSGTVRIAVDTSVNPPIGKVYYSAGLTVTCSGMGGCTMPVSGSAFGVDDIQIANWTTTSGTFDPGPGGGTDLRGMLNRSRTLAGTGMTSTYSGGTQTLSVNTAVIPIFTLAPGTGTALASATTITPTNRGHHITGTTPIATITATSMIDGEILTLIPDAAFTTTTAGNIGIASTAVAGKTLRFYWDSTAVKWYPSY